MKILRGNQGIALFMAIFVMSFFLLFITGTLVFSQLGIRSTGNLKLAAQALQVADAGLQHALAVIPSGSDFNAQLACVTPPCTVVSNTSFPAGSGFSYTITAENDPPDTTSPGSPTNDTNGLIILKSTAFGPSNTKKEIQAYVKRSLTGFTPPGAVYLTGNPATVIFNGSTFFMTGNDTAYDGTPASNPKPAISGVAPISDSVRDAFKSALGSSRYNLAQGQGYNASTSPITPSINTTSNVLDVNQIALNFFNHPNAVKYLDGLTWNSPNCPSKNPCILGTDSSPQITYIKEGSSHIHLGGYINGSGVLVVEGSKIHIEGNFNYHGLVIGIQISPSSETGSEMTGFAIRDDAKISGGVLMGLSSGTQFFYLRDTAKIYYSSQGVTMATNLCGSCFSRPARVVAWLDR